LAKLSFGLGPFRCLAVLYLHNCSCENIFLYAFHVLCTGNFGGSGNAAFQADFCDLPTVDANHDHAGEVETDTARYDGVGGREVQGACGVLFAIVLENQRLVRTMDAQRDGHKRDEGGQQPNGGDGDDSHASCHPAAVSAREEGNGGREVKGLHQFAAKEAEIHAPCLLLLLLIPGCSWRFPFCPFALAVSGKGFTHTHTHTHTRSRSSHTREKFHLNFGVLKPLFN